MKSVGLGVGMWHEVEPLPYLCESLRFSFDVAVLGGEILVWNTNSGAIVFLFESWVRYFFVCPFLGYT